MSERERQAAAKIVSSYVRRNQVPGDQIGVVISTVYESLIRLGKPAEDTAERTPAVPVRRSVHRDYVICLECAARAKMLKRHLASAHGMSAHEYRTRWGLPQDHPLTALGYSEQRSSLAKKLGLGKRRTEPEQAIPDASNTDDGNLGIEAPQPAEPQQEQAA